MEDETMKQHRVDRSQLQRAEIFTHTPTNHAHTFPCLPENVQV